MAGLSNAYFKRISSAIVALGLVCEVAFASAPDSSLRPLPRPSVQASSHSIWFVPLKMATPTDVRPRPRPRFWGAPVIARSAIVDATHHAVTRSLRPEARPNGISHGFDTVASKPRRAGSSGRICGVNAIRGQAISAIPGKIRGCGISDPVRVTEVSGVSLSQAAVMDCTTAKALNRWVRDGVFRAVGRLGGGPSSLRVAAHYACRTRNNKPGAKISEHGRGRAIDISAVRLKNGAEISVLKGWRDPVQGKALRVMHKKACGLFGTVLGPNADRYHKDHFHLDTARHRGGSYCK